MGLTRLPLPSQSFDFVELREGEHEDSPLIGRYCGREIPTSYASQANTIFVRFKTDHSIGHDGFRIRYETSKKDVNCFVLLFVSRWIFLVSSVCGGEYAAPSGIITSPFHPNPYPSNRECIYIIAQPLGTKITLNFLDFDIEASRLERRRCAYDYLEIRDGDSADSSLIDVVCGDPTLIPDPIQSAHNFVWMK